MSKGEESAFPNTEANVTYGVNSYGLTKRELISAMLTQGILSACQGWPESEFADEVVRRALIHTDALLAALNEGD